MKRFWNSVERIEVAGGFAIALDRRRVKTPARADLIVPAPALADAIAEEWNVCGETVDPRAMPLTGLANAAIDHIIANPATFAAGLASFGESDLLYYRAEGPDLLIRRQTELWDPLLDNARRRYGIEFATAKGIMPVEQPPETVRKFREAVAALDPFTLAGLSPLVTIGGSLVAALAVLEQMVSVESAWAAVSLDDQWQIDRWGADAEAVASMELRQRDFHAGARFLDLLC